MEITIYKGSDFAKAKKLIYARTLFFESLNPTINFDNETIKSCDEAYNMVLDWNLRNEHLNGIDRRLHLFYTLNNEVEFLDFKNDEQKLLFYMFAMDPFLNLLKISYEESNIKNIKERYKQEFGYKLDNYLLNVEKSFNKKFNAIEDEYNIKRSLNK